MATERLAFSRGNLHTTSSRPLPDVGQCKMKGVSWVIIKALSSSERTPGSSSKLSIPQKKKDTLLGRVA